MTYQELQRRCYELIYERRQLHPGQSFQNRRLLWYVVLGIFMEILKSWVSAPAASLIVIAILIATWLFLSYREARSERGTRLEAD